ncbi:MAG: hypothetical protein LC768_12415 [Acidobacteria bacterium]|nr:hypothetical protein [Acidobacteriota bacterium]MCA1639115.1 hypothetical protein [Acidobacteriota bacterium]
MVDRTKQNFDFKANVLAVIALLSVLCVNAVVASAGSTNEPVKINDWQVVGPTGGDVRVIAVDPKDKERLYISTLDGQLHTSADGGKTWRLLVNFNRPQLILDQLIVDSRDSNIIYTSGHRHKDPGGFFKTTDGGLTWKEAKELKKESIHAMVQSASDPNVILVGTISGVWMSKDSGDDWKKVSSEPMPVVDSLAVDPRTSDTIYAGTVWRAYKSTDSGKNWRLIKDGMIDDSDVFAITVNPRNPDHIVASACSGIYESYNKGEKWKKIQGIPSQSRRTRDILQHPTKAGTIYAATTEGFWMTSDNGKSWILTTTRDLEINSITVHPDDPERVFIGTNNYGVMVSNDGGKNFAQTNVNFTSRFTYSITPDVEQSNRLYATTHNTSSGGGFVFISNDGGVTWQQARDLDVNRVSPFTVMQDRANPNTMYLGTNLGLFRSLDRGDSWIQITVPKPAPVKKPVRKKPTKGKAAKGRLTKSKTVAPKPAPVMPQPTTATVPGEPKLVPVLTETVKVLTPTEDGKNGMFAGTDKGLYRSYDLTKGWEKISFGTNIDENIFVVFATSKQPETIWVGTAGSGVIVSRDSGATWQKVTGVPEDVPVSSIVVDPNRPDYVYVGTSQMIYLSRDGGKTWRRGGNLPLGNFTSILINPHNSNEVFASSALESDGGIFFSKDEGANWKRMDSKEMKLPSRRIWSMAFDPNDSNRIFAGTHSSGVYRIERAPSTASNQTLVRPRIITAGN